MKQGFILYMTPSCVTIQVKVITQYFHDVLFSVWKILGHLGIKEFTEHLCSVFYQTFGQ